MSQMADMIDHTLLAPDATTVGFNQLCQEANLHRFKTVCVPPMWVAHCSHQLLGHPTEVCTVIGFPLGYTFSKLKARETGLAIEHGADEIDMVMNISLAKEGRWRELEADVALVRSHCESKVLKVILETCLLTDAEIMNAAKACEQAGADFIKTSTGFSKSGASVHAVELMRKSVSSSVAIKASGGIRDLQTAKQMLAAGATRLGTSSGVAIVTGAQGESSNY